MTYPPPTRPVARRGSSHVSAIALITASLALVISVLAFLDVGSNVSPPTDEHTDEPPRVESENGPTATEAKPSAPRAQPPEQSPNASSEQSSPTKKPEPSAPEKTSPKDNASSNQSKQNANLQSSANTSNGGGSKANASSADPSGSSPIPQAGHHTDSPKPAQRLNQSDGTSIPPQASGPPDDQVLSWKQAPRYLGYRVTVQGKIVDTHMIKSGEICFLNFSKQWRGKFYLAMFKEAFTGLADPPQDYYRNKTIRVSGEVKNHEGRPQIQIHNLDQIRVIPPTSASDS